MFFLSGCKDSRTNSCVWKCGNKSFQIQKILEIKTVFHIWSILFPYKTSIFCSFPVDSWLFSTHAKTIESKWKCLPHFSGFYQHLSANLSESLLYVALSDKIPIENQVCGWNMRKWWKVNTLATQLLLLYSDLTYFVALSSSWSHSAFFSPQFHLSLHLQQLPNAANKSILHFTSPHRI